MRLEDQCGGVVIVVSRASRASDGIYLSRKVVGLCILDVLPPSLECQWDRKTECYSVGYIQCSVA